jgi:hypothetical protein
MTNTNTPNGASENPENPKKDISRNIDSLLKFAIEKELGKPIDPRKFDTYKKNKDNNRENIRLTMLDIRQEDPENWWDIDEKTIDQETTDIKISDQILRIGTTLVLRRKRAFDRALELFPTIRWNTQDESILRTEIAGYNEDELHAMITKSSVMRERVRVVFPDRQTANSTEIRQFDDIFTDVDMYFNVEDKKKLEKIYHNYYQFKQVPDGGDIDWILQHYTGLSAEKKKEILVALETTLTLKDAYDWGLIDDQFIGNLAENGYEDIYNQLDESGRKSFIRGLRHNESLVIAASDFQSSNLDSLFWNQKTRRQLAQQVFRSIWEDMPEELKKPDTGFASQIKQEKMQAAKDSWVEEEDWDIFEECVKKLRALWTIKNVEKMKEGAIIQFKKSNGEIQYVRIKTVYDDVQGVKMPHKILDWEKGIELESLSLKNGILKREKTFPTTYDGFIGFFKNPINQDFTILASDFDGRLTQNIDDVRAEWSDKIYEDSGEHVDANTIRAKIDELDSEWIKYGFEPGTGFVMPVYDDSGKIIDQEGVFTVDKIYWDKIDLKNPYGSTRDNTGIPLDQFYDAVKNTQGFKRVSKITNDHEFLHHLEIFDLPHGTEIKDGKLVYKDHWAWDDEHGHSSHKEEEKEITCFASEDNGHIRMWPIEGWVVSFGEFESTTKMEDLQKYAEKHGADKKIEWQYKWRQMSYWAFLEYLKKNKFKASKKDLIVPEAAHSHEWHWHHPHLHGSFWGKIMKFQNPASIWKGFEMIIHGIEQKLEKWAKLDAARFAMKTSRFLQLPDVVSAEIFATVVDGSKEILEKTEKEINNLPGPKQRLECLHIIENTDSRPEDVAAAIAYMLKGYGHLYAEDIKHKQSKTISKKNCISAPCWYFLFFDAFVMTSGMGDLHEWRKKAYDRALTEMGTEDKHEGEPTEEQLIHALFKMLDGKWWDTYPYAASVMKAMGGPSGFEKMWKFEWYENAYKKGKEQSQMVNAQGRLNKAVSYFASHEIYKAVGAMEAMAAKIKSPEYQAMPFIWACWWFSQHASHAALQKLKWYWENGLSFHAFSFLRNKESNDLYRDTVKLALQDLAQQNKIPAEAVWEFSVLCKRLETPESDDDKKKKDKDGKTAAVRMMEFWKRYQWKWLHDMLQWQTGWLIKKRSEGHKTAQAYWDTIQGGHGMQLLKDAIPAWTDFGPDWYDEHWYQNIILAEGKDEHGNTLMSLSSMLNKIQFEWTASGWGRSMKDDHYKKIWSYVKKYMLDKDQLRNTGMFLWDKDTQKKQYLAHRKEILRYMAEKMTTRTTTGRVDPEVDKANINRNISTYRYYQDLIQMWIDPHAVFDEELETKNAESDYQNWINNRSANISSTSVNDVAQLFAHKANDATNNRG